MRNTFEHLLSWVYTRVFFGPRCPDFEPACYCCEAWDGHDQLFN